MTSTVSAPPRTRGSTALAEWQYRGLGGSPAHAGIDLPETLMSEAFLRLPRARGDRPP